jgi:hypothetical protein
MKQAILAAYPFGRASQHLWLVNNHDGCGDSLALTMPVQPSPRTAVMLGVPRSSHDDDECPCGRGCIVPAASYCAVASAACAGGLLVMEHEVPLTRCALEQSFEQLRVALMFLLWAMAWLASIHTGMSAWARNVAAE